MIYFNEIPKYHRNGKKKTKDELYSDYINHFRYKCKCGHTLILRPCEEKKLCSYCGNYFYKDKKMEFKKLLKERIKAQLEEERLLKEKEKLENELHRSRQR